MIPREGSTSKIDDEIPVAVRVVVRRLLVLLTVVTRLLFTLVVPNLDQSEKIRRHNENVLLHNRKCVKMELQLQSRSNQMFLGNFAKAQLTHNT